MGVCHRRPSEGESIGVLESTLVVPVIEGVRGLTFMTCVGTQRVCGVGRRRCPCGHTLL